MPAHVAPRRYTDSNYRGLQALQDKYGPRGFQVLAFPCNQFGQQEPGGPGAIAEFQKKYGVSFPVFGKVDVNGQNTAPVFRLLKSELGAKVEGGEADLNWNFNKFLVDKNGHPVKRYWSNFDAAELERDVERLLDAPAGTGMAL